MVNCVHSCSDNDRLLRIAPFGSLDKAIKAVEISFQLIQANWVDFLAIVDWLLQLHQTQLRVQISIWRIVMNENIFDQSATAICEIDHFTNFISAAGGSTEDVVGRN